MTPAIPDTVRVKGLCACDSPACWTAVQSVIKFYFKQHPAEWGKNKARRLTMTYRDQGTIHEIPVWIYRTKQFICVINAQLYPSVDSRGPCTAIAA